MEVLWKEIHPVNLSKPKSYFKLFDVETKPPKTIIPDDCVIFPDPKSDTPDAEYIKSHFYEEGKLTEAQVLRIVQAGTKLLTSETNLLELETPATSTS